MANRLGPALVHVFRQHGSDFLARCADPHAELLALVWGPRFDRQQAHSLLPVKAGQRGTLWAAATNAADCYDLLNPAAQHRLRHLIVRHQRRCHNFPCPEFS